ncbi:MAG: Esterase [Actinomycetia bacterium]|nr:Esterase [Actinomycetes bacterium]
MTRWCARLFLLLASLAAVNVMGSPTPRPSHEQTVGAAASSDAFGDAVDLGSMRGKTLAQPVVGMAATRTGRGYWLVARDGGIFTFGDAKFFGSTGGKRLNQPIVGMTASGSGYWFVAADGGIFAFGDAKFFGSTGGRRLAAPIAGMASTPTGRGYWLVARDGAVFAFGDARHYGAPTHVAQSVTGLTATATGKGYWISASDGRVFAFGDARTLASTGAATPTPTVAVAATPDGSGYWAAAGTGAVRAYGSAPQYGAATAGSAVVGMARTPSGKGYWLVTAQGDVLTKAATATSGAYGFLAKDRSGRPLRYNPCQPVRYVINPAGAPAGAVDEVRESFRRLGAVTGLQFVDAGTTTETHVRVGTTARPSYQPERYGTGQWAPILISWVTQADEPILAGAVLGYGGSTSYWTSASDQAYVTGEVVFDRDLSLVHPGFGTGLSRGNLVQHELGHVVGLDHVQDRAQVMFPSISDRSPDGYGAGDRAGLTQLGAQAGCLRIASPA